MKFAYKATFTPSDTRIATTEYLVTHEDREWIDSPSNEIFFIAEDGNLITFDVESYVERIVYDAVKLADCNDKVVKGILSGTEKLKAIGDYFEMHFDTDVGENDTIVGGDLKVEAVAYPKVDKEKTIKESELYDCTLPRIKVDGEVWLKEGDECSLGWYFINSPSLINTALFRAISAKYKELRKLNVCVCDDDSVYTKLTLCVTSLEIVKPILEEFFSCKVTKPIVPNGTVCINGETWYEYSALLYDVQDF